MTKTLESVPVWNVAQFGWTCTYEQNFGNTAVTTWTLDEHVLVLVWQGAAEVTAAVLDGTPLPLDELAGQVLIEADETSTIYDRAALHAGHLSGRIGTELGALFDAMLELRVDEKLSAPVGLRNRIRNLALATLSTPAR